jgi:uncharacterized membrane protein
VDFSLAFLASLLFRWLHLLAAIAAVGGTIFIRFALLPSMSILPEEHRKSLQDALRSRWSKVVMAAILLLLVSGLYNFFVILRGLAANPHAAEIKGMYHAFFGIKVLLALAIFFIASALVGRSAAFDKMRANARFWATVNIALAVLLICISGFLRFSRDSLNGRTGDAPRAAQTTHGVPATGTR